MTSPALALPASMPTGVPIRPRRLMLAAILVALADWLLYDHGLGISVALFLAALAAISTIANAAEFRSGRRLPAFSVLVLGLLPLVENVGVLSVCFALAGLALFAVLMAGGSSGRPIEILRAARGLLLSGPLRLEADLRATLQNRTESGWPGLRADPVLRWLVPIAVCAFFGLLFVLANPIIAQWLGALSSAVELPRIGTARLLFWSALIVAIWPFLAIKLRKRASGGSEKLADPQASDGMNSVLAPILDTTTIRRCLVLLNLLFAMQSGLDITYLWAGVALPDGMTYAQYAHRGAYPLMLTALLAAAFVIATMRPGGPARNSALIRGLVYLWIGQNLLLVGSSILRLDLYVATYSLTFLRLTAMVWMALVAVGLALIFAQIVLRRSNAWLIGANLIAVVATLYAFALVNTSAVIADFNIAHSREITGLGVNFDLSYAGRLGPQAIPAIDRYVTAIPTAAYANTFLRDRLAVAHALAMADWRAWTFRGWRLQRYLREYEAEANPPTPMSSAPGVE